MSLIFAKSDRKGLLSSNEHSHHWVGLVTELGRKITFDDIFPNSIQVTARMDENDAFLVNLDTLKLLCGSEVFPLWVRNPSLFNLSSMPFV